MRDDNKDARKVIPFHTGKVAIGRAWQPRITPTQASAIEYHAGRRVSFARWAGWSAFAVLALVIIAGVSRG